MENRNSFRGYSSDDSIANSKEAGGAITPIPAFPLNGEGAEALKGVF